MSTCPHCGKSIDRYAVTCRYCGRTLRVDSWNSRVNELRAAEEKKRADQLSFLQWAFQAKGQNNPSKPSQNAKAPNEEATLLRGEEAGQHVEVPDSRPRENMCPKCNQPTPEDSVFCVKCGQSLISDEIETNESNVLDYISSHDGEISISQACKDMKLSERDLLEAIERLKEKKILAL